ncbi:c-type cytochrome [Halomonas getboli]|uniref:c-type cytochrome n=1 Tax=Halomonas getboli TaxID=2935862 RepID=UPI001FFE6B1B|nr:cytochrome c [Halomonas getboli]MCK2183628.1 cytochrome c [Halomonas getboli]
MNLWHGLSIGGVAVALGAGTFIYSGLYNVSAQEEHLPVVEWALHTTMRQSVDARAESIETPDLTDTAKIRQGASAYESLCAACHLTPGMDDTVLRQGLNPMPPNLTEPGDVPPEEQFWIIDNGIKMTGMPSWGATHEDQELWELVAFLQEMPSLSERQYEALLQDDGQGTATASSGTPRADDGHDHEHGDMSAMSDAHDESEPESAPADDGHAHHDH